jgi:hypothetical protein
MSAIFDPPKPKGPDPALVAAQKQQIDQANARDAELTAEEDARKRALASRLQGRRSLLGPGGEVGVGDLKNTLGG